MRALKTLTVFACVVAMAGCGGEEENQEQGTRGGKHAAEHARLMAAAAAEQEAVAGPSVGRPNERWDKLKVHFLGLENDPSTGFVRGTIGTIRDPFEPMLVKFVPRIALDDEDRDEASIDEIDAPLPPEFENPPQPVDLSPTQRFKTVDYRVLLIRWGTSVNKALVSDPSGSTFIVTEDMKLGNNNGRVTDITRYDVVVKEDNRNEPIVLSIQPPILKIAESDSPTERLFDSQTLQ